MQIADFIVDYRSSIMEAVEKMNRNSKGIIFVVEETVLCGVITDGDIRRYILGNGDLGENVSAIYNKNPQYLFYDNKEKAYEIINKKGIRAIPILNNDKEILKIYLADKEVKMYKEKLEVPVVIMAGGKGTRLYPYTQILPKPLIPIGDKTITEHIMNRFEDLGCYKFYMIINYKKHFIKSYFEDNENKRDVVFIEEKDFLGTGGGLKLIDGIINETFFMTNCDILIEEDYSKIVEFHRKNHNIVTMVCAEKNMVIPYGTVEVLENGRAVELKEKPELSFLTNTGLYILEPEFLKHIPENTFVHITDIIQKCIDEGKNVGVYKISEENWMDMGQLEELERMKKKLNVK